MSGRVDVEADNVLEFLCELWIVRQLERVRMPSPTLLTVHGLMPCGQYALKGKG